MTRKFLGRHPGLLFAALGCGIGMALWSVGMETWALFVVSIWCLNIGDAWDEETIR